jgi:hypothetical protein
MYIFIYTYVCVCAYIVGVCVYTAYHAKKFSRFFYLLHLIAALAGAENGSITSVPSIFETGEVA